MAGIRLSKAQVEIWRKFITLHAILIERIDFDLKQAQAVPLNWYDVLFALWETPNRTLTPKQLTKSVVLSKSTLTRILDRLEEQQLISRDKSENDGRSYVVALTERGIEAMKIAWPIYSNRVANDFIKTLKKSGDEDSFLSTLNSLIDELA